MAKGKKTIPIEAGICPKCGKTDLDYASSEIRDECIKYPYTCGDCGFEGIEWYNIVFSCHYDLQGNEIS